MFNNPFDSFHNIVAEAKEEREQLDRLLTISTPRERLIVGAIAVVLVVLAAWLFFGNVARSVSMDGVLAAGGDKRSVQALVWVAGDVAPGIEPGMRAAIELGKADGGVATLDGRVSAISTVPLSGALTAFAEAAPIALRRVLIALDEDPDPASLAGRKCRIVIELGRQSPAAFLRMGRS